MILYRKYDNFDNSHVEETNDIYVDRYDNNFRGRCDQRLYYANSS